MAKPADALPPPPFHAPCRCLVPADLAHEFEGGGSDGGGATEGSIGEVASKLGATLRVGHEAEEPSLSDLIVTVHGEPAVQLRICREIVLKLRKMQDSSDVDAAPFVILVPSSAAGAVVGTRGNQVRTLIKSSGADIEISREILPRLAAQPVTINGTLDQALAATAGIQDIMQSLVSRGRLVATDFNGLDIGDHCAAAPTLGGDAHVGAPSQDASHAVVNGRRVKVLAPSGLGSSEPCTAAASAPVVLMVPMDVAGWIIGKQGRRVAELQHTSRAKIAVASGREASLPGMRCGDRLVEISGGPVATRKAGLEAVVAVIAEAPYWATFKPPVAQEASPPLTLLVPAIALGYVIGTSGQAVKELRSRLAVEVTFNDGVLIGGAVPALVCGARAAQVGAIVELIARVDEVVARQAGQGQGPPSELSVDGGPAPEHEGLLRVEEVKEQRPFGSSPAVPPMTSSGRSGEEEVLRSHAVGLGPLGRGGGGSGGTFLRGPRTSSEAAVLSGIEASGILNHRLTIRVSRPTLGRLDIGELAIMSGARLEIEAPTVEDPGHCFVTLVGQRLSTTRAALHLQEEMARGL